MEIEVGEYVRLARNQGINKIEEILIIDLDTKDFKRYILEEEIGNEYGEIVDYIDEDELDDEILKHSKDIIDLVEVEDYVNEYRVDEIKDGVLISNPKGIDRSGAFIPIAQYSKDIKSILTHEQYEKMAYRLEE